MRLFKLLVFIVCAVAAHAVEAQSPYGIYTNMKADAGEPSGMEMYLLNNGKPGACDTSVLLQMAEGWPQYPELLDCCGCTGNNVAFISAQLGKFVGRIDNGVLVGEFVESRYPVKLKKGQGFWQQ